MNIYLGVDVSAGVSVGMSNVRAVWRGCGCGSRCGCVTSL